MRVALTFIALSLGAAACSATPAPAPVLPKATASTEPIAGSADGATRRVRSRTLDFPLELRLPSKEGWLVDERSWLVATHAASSSQVALRTWRADRLVRRTDCLAQARLARPALPVVREESVVERRPFQAPLDMASELVVGVEPSEHGLSGYALVVGSSVGRCYAAVFTTQADGARSEQEIAARLGMAVDQVLSSVRIRSVDERAVRRRLVVTSPGSGRE